MTMPSLKERVAAAAHWADLVDFHYGIGSIASRAARSDLARLERALILARKCGLADDAAVQAAAEELVKAGLLLHPAL